MRRYFVVALIALALPCAAAQTYDFDKLNDGGATPPSVKKVDGVSKEVQQSLQRHRDKFAEEAEIKRKMAEEASNRYKAERAVGNGSRYYKCEFICRTNGLLGDATDKMTLTVKADESWQANDKLARETAAICGKFRGNVDFHRGESMWSSNERCEEIR